MQRGLKALGKVEAQRFIIENMLEAVKKGSKEKNIQSTFDHFQQLGLVNSDTSAQVDPISDEVKSPPSQNNEGKFLFKIWNKLKRAKVMLFQVTVNALRLIPKFVGIKPRIGIAGPFATIDFEINLEMKSISVHDFIEMLAENVWPDSPDA